MIEATYLKTEPHKANAIDKRAIHNLIPYLKWEIERDDLDTSIEQICDESNYRIVKIDGYENIIFYNDFCDYYLQTVQPIDRENNKLFPIQAIELQVNYKRY